MTDLAVRGDALPDLAPPPVQPAPQRVTGNPAADMLVSWARGAQAADYLAGPVSGTKFAGAFRNDKEGATAAILYGAEVGLTPIQALQAVHVVKDRPGLYARTMHAILLAAGHEVWTETATASEVVVCGRRRGSSHVERVKWTLDRARRAGYVQQNKRYELDPEGMLWARAVSDCCRRVAPDALAGLSYSVEELEDEPATAAPTRTATADEPTKRTARRKPQPAPQVAPPDLDEPVDTETRELPQETTPSDEAPDLDPAPELPNPPTPPVEPASRIQVAKIQAMLNGRGIRDRDERLADLSERVGRNVVSTDDLTKAEASRVIKSLEQTQREGS